MEAMEDAVKDAILTNEFEDIVLFRLVDLTVSSIREARPLFSTLLSEPAFYRIFQRWVLEALDERETIERMKKEDED